MRVFYRPKECQLVEEFGEVVSATVVVRVIEVPGSLMGEILTNARSATGLPIPGESLNAALPMVRLQYVRPKYVGRQKLNGVYGHVVDVVCEYVLQREDVPILLRGGGSLSQIQTARLKNGDPIEVSYNDDTKRIELTVMEVQGFEEWEIVVATDDPAAIKKQWLNYVNNDTFRDCEPMTWCVTDVSFERVCMATSPRRWKFRFQLTYNPAKWVYTGVYKLADGTIPADIVEGTGIKDFEWHDRVDFSDTFG